PKAPAVTATPTQACVFGWQVVQSPDLTYNDILFSVAVVAPNDVWAVGEDGINGDNTLVERWDGSQWSIVNSPDVPGAEQNVLHQVVAVSSNDIWAIGFVTVGNAQQQTLIEHWDGTQWSIVSSPNVPDSQDDMLLAGSAIGPNDIWAVGWYVTA